MNQLHHAIRQKLNTCFISWRIKGLHSSAQRSKVSEFLMPAMSPTMSEGGISRWRVAEGSNFSAGDVLLEIETDKATIDVEAQDDGVMGKIIVGDSAKNVQVGQLIALLAEEGDDISSLEVPTPTAKPPEQPAQESSQYSKPPSQPTPSSPIAPTNQSLSQSIKINQSKPMFPSVLRLLEENGISPEKVKGTGVRGMLTKGDVLAFIGQASTPTGTWKAIKESPIPQSVQKLSPKELTPLEIRRLIVEGLSEANRKQTPAPSLPPATCESILAGYISSTTLKPATTSSLTQKPARGYLDGLI